MKEQTVCGVKACLALWEHRPQDVIRLYHGRTLRGELGALLSWAASQRIPYRELDEEGLRKVARATHHEGLVMVSRPLRYQAFAPERVLAAGGPWLALDGVENPHNLGAILRTCAFFGVAGVLAGGALPGNGVNTAVLRVAEGGAEHVPLFGEPSLADALAALSEAGLRVIGLESDGRLSLARALEDGDPAACVLVLGHEQAGLSPEVRRACRVICALGGRGRLTSLNVSVAAGVALAELLREESE